MQFRTLLILLAIGPPLLAGACAVYREAMAEYRKYRLKQAFSPVRTNPPVQISGTGLRHFDTDARYGFEPNP